MGSDRMGGGKGESKVSRCGSRRVSDKGEVPARHGFGVACLPCGRGRPKGRSAGRLREEQGRRRSRRETRRNRTSTKPEATGRADVASRNRASRQRGAVQPDEDGGRATVRVPHAGRRNVRQ